MISALFLYSPRGDLIISKLIKDNIKLGVSEIFRIQVINNLDVRSPILTLGSTTFHHIRSNGGLWLVTVSRGNTDSAGIWEFLYNFNKLLEVYDINSEDSLQGDFMLCYEILDIVLDNGIPRDTELTHIMPYISKKPLSENLLGSDDILNTPSWLVKAGARGMSSENLGLTSKDMCLWRSEGIRYKKNEVYLDVFEHISILVNKDGAILKSYVDGSVQCVAHLSGMPVCQFGFNDYLSPSSNTQSSGNDGWAEEENGTKAIKNAITGSVILEDCKFHQCVQLDKFDQERVIRFVPPDGLFELMKYHVRDNLNLPFKVTPMVTTLKGKSVEYRITLKSLFPSKLCAKDVELYIPAPPDTVNAKINVSSGKGKFIPEENAIVWKIHKYHGLTENVFSAVIVPMGNGNDSLNLEQWSRPPISVRFEISMFSNSGLVVRYLKVMEKDLNYNTVKWVKYISKSGAYEVRY
ncbi:Apm4p Ecym_5239 [Eremothecium cymbalariae DBVPG|uniref:MHD domain-containing protein n=1 Tax=Eremothecium cymbalariae (strain CBS 270.75 / DBVPG 7215 / KCTC 17166 / NRRL Y-17582) TaxID=931890 RepID=I6ND64_ERECY|nr:hypothetical protein Ecym_5239 [Eremothecium cymbalariae DBVPG\